MDDIVVVMQPCYEGCSTCGAHIGQTALVARTYRGHDEVTLEFAEHEQRGGFFGHNLWRTGAVA